MEDKRPSMEEVISLAKAVHGNTPAPGAQNHSGMYGGQLLDLFGGGVNFIRINFSKDLINEVLSEELGETKWVEPWFEGLLISVYTLLMCVGIMGNSLVCYVIIHNPQMRTPRNYYICNLSISDLTLCLICMPLTLIRLIRRDWPLGLAMCRLLPTFLCSNIYISTISITAMALDRYNVIMSKHIQGGRTQQNRVKWTILSIVLIWIVGFVLSIPVFIYSEVEANETCLEHVGCITFYKICKQKWPAWQNVVLVVIQYLLPLIVLCTAHIRISMFLKKHQRPPQKRRKNQDPDVVASSGGGATSTVAVRTALNTVVHAADNNTYKRSRERKFKAVSVLVAIAVVFAISWLPYNIFNLMSDYYRPLVKVPYYVHLYALCHIIAMTSACSNPILYGWLNNNFQAEFRSVLGICCDRVRRQRNRRNVTKNDQPHNGHCQYQAVTGNNTAMPPPIVSGCSPAQSTADAKINTQSADICLETEKALSLQSKTGSVNGIPPSGSADLSGDVML